MVSESRIFSTSRESLLGTREECLVYLEECRV